MSDSVDKRHDRDLPAGTTLAARTDDPRALAAAVRSLGLSLADLRASYAARVGVSAAELVALEHLDVEGDLSPGELARRLHLTTGAVTALADRLTERGHMIRSPHPSDRRMLLLHRTEHAAEELRRHIWPMAMDMMTVTEALSEEERAVVGRFLEEVIRVVERHAVVEEQPTDTGTKGPADR